MSNFFIHSQSLSGSALRQLWHDSELHPTPKGIWPIIQKIDEYRMKNIDDLFVSSRHVSSRNVCNMYACVFLQLYECRNLLSGRCYGLRHYSILSILNSPHLISRLRSHYIDFTLTCGVLTWEQPLTAWINTSHGLFLCFNRCSHDAIL